MRKEIKKLKKMKIDKKKKALIDNEKKLKFIFFIN